ncbi:hypothetical protein F0562_001813 [Nyssa sinensis]|uniref:Strictosidine synthase conserved region domain-containing protein n=1 Tax=Nyssa sinensis TaxID=561372 RepID=A0A5J5C4Q7_9ASTE|nr:hypothetical protein F0562_001813 [Nyssa sinensis]
MTMSRWSWSRSEDLKKKEEEPRKKNDRLCLWLVRVSPKSQRRESGTSCRSIGRLRKYWLEGEKAGTSEVMAILPGFPDNVKINKNGEFWVAVNSRRTMYTYLSSLYPKIRKFLLKLPIPEKIQYLLHTGGSPHAVVVKYSPEGKILQILEDSEGKVVNAVSEVEEKDGKLWMGSVSMPYVAVYELS